MFQGFRQKVEVGYWAVVVEGGGIQTRFFKDWGDSGIFEGRRDSSKGQ